MGASCAQSPRPAVEAGVQPIAPTPLMPERGLGGGELLGHLLPAHDVPVVAALVEAVQVCLQSGGAIASGSACHQLPGGQCPGASGAASWSLVAMLGYMMGVGEQPGSEAAVLTVLQGLSTSRLAPLAWPGLWEAFGIGGREVEARREAAAVGLSCSVAWVLQRTEPLLHAALQGGDGVGLAAAVHAVLRWLSGTPAASTTTAGCSSGLGIAFCSRISAAEVLKLLVLQLACGADYLVYAAAAVRFCLLGKCVDKSTQDTAFCPLVTAAWGEGGAVCLEGVCVCVCVNPCNTLRLRSGPPVKLAGTSAGKRTP
jgi:hypothetical protein